MKDSGFTVCDVGPCLMLWKDKTALCFVALHIGDNLAVGYPRAIHKLIQKFNDHVLTLKFNMRYMITFHLRLLSQKMIESMA